MLGVCTPCGAGTASNGSTTVCMSCDAPLYSPAPGATMCSLCNFPATAMPAMSSTTCL
jgi:hypothetical protein